MKKRRIEITVSRRRTTIHQRNQPAGTEPQLHQADALHTVTTDLASAEVLELHQPQSTLLPPAILALTKWGGDEDHLSEVETEAELKRGSQ